MIPKEDCMALILKEIPEFDTSWRLHLDYWEDEIPGLCNDMNAFAKYVTEILQHKSKNDYLEKIFAVVELLISDGDDSIKDATATCFIETLLNKASSMEVDSGDFVPFLGPESRAYAKAWDKFTGIVTKGL
ncbi:MAG: hypothetical protein GY799_21555 [Desulfobulbaceae bacterium]|nr:hypothetical protein [Desulfobulbaceae bacterium]